MIPFSFVGCNILPCASSVHMASVRFYYSGAQHPVRSQRGSSQGTTIPGPTVYTDIFCLLARIENLSNC